MYSDTENLDLVKQYLHTKGFTDISSYKAKYFERRLTARMKEGKCNSYLEYYSKLKKDPEEVKILRNSFSTNVTSFFRDIETWNQFRTELKAYFTEKKKQQLPRSINIWSAGCAIGAEPYSIAILLHELLGKNLLSYEKNLKIFATDFNEELLTIARKGIFEGDVMKFVPDNILKQFFDPFGPKKRVFKVKYNVKKYVTFSYLDLTVFKHWKQNLDAIVCRNVLIYFSKELQEQILKKFHQFLLPGGLLLLGGTEILHSSLRDSFDLLSVTHKIYRKKKALKSIKKKNQSSIPNKTNKESVLGLKCKHCGTKFTRLTELQAHGRKSNCMQKIFRCKLCRKEFDSKIRLDVHMKYFHNYL